MAKQKIVLFLVSRLVLAFCCWPLKFFFWLVYHSFAKDLYLVILSYFHEVLGISYIKTNYQTADRSISNVSAQISCYLCNKKYFRPTYLKRSETTSFWPNLRHNGAYIFGNDTCTYIFIIFSATQTLFSGLILYNIYIIMYMSGCSFKLNTSIV